MEEICKVITDGNHQAPPKSKNGIPFLVISDVISGRISFHNCRFVPEDYYNNLDGNRRAEYGDILFTVTGSYGKPIPVDTFKPFCFQRHIGLIKPLIHNDYLMAVLSSDYILKECNKTATGTAQKTVGLESIRNFLIPIPSQKEQEKICKEIAIYNEIIDEITANKEILTCAISLCKSKILDLAMQGKLVEQNPSDESASDMLRRINPKAKIITDNPHSRNIPSKWGLCRFGDIADISRGGSPRPIKSYITNDPNGVNWIKIGDTDGKYINSTKEKIIQEGVKMSREVKKGDFLLTNSMSFGKPYILNIDGCIHDGWLVISPKEDSYDKDFLYYLLSSQYAYSQFSEKAGGAVVSNLNSDKVANTLFPLLSISEQKRIVSKIEDLYSILDKIEATLQS